MSNQRNELLSLPPIATEAATWLGIAAAAHFISQKEHAPAFMERVAQVGALMGAKRVIDATTEFATVKIGEEYSPNLGQIAHSVTETAKETARTAQAAIKFAFNIYP